MQKLLLGLHFKGEVVYHKGEVLKLVKPTNRAERPSEIFIKDITWDVIKLDTRDKWRRSEVKGCRFKRYNKPVVQRVKPDSVQHYSSATRHENYVAPTERFNVQSFIAEIELTPEERRHLKSIG